MVCSLPLRVFQIRSLLSGVLTTSAEAPVEKTDAPNRYTARLSLSVGLSLPVATSQNCTTAFFEEGDFCSVSETAVVTTVAPSGVKAIAAAEALGTPRRSAPVAASQKPRVPLLLSTKPRGPSVLA